jgi:hypothetical protein
MLFLFKVTTPGSELSPSEKGAEGNCVFGVVNVHSADITAPPHTGSRYPGAYSFGGELKGASAANKCGPRHARESSKIFSALKEPLARYRGVSIGWQAFDSLDASIGQSRRARLRLLARGGWAHSGTSLPCTVNPAHLPAAGSGAVGAGSMIRVFGEWRKCTDVACCSKGRAPWRTHHNSKQRCP